MPALLKACARGGSCDIPVPGRFNGTFSVTSMGGVATTFLLEWFKRLEKARAKTFDCGSDSTSRECMCAALAPPLHLVSCDVDDDGVFKHLAEPRVLNRFSNHRAIYVVGSPVAATESVFRRDFQCWHMHRLQNCWFSRDQREGVIPHGPLSSLEAYAEQREDLFGSSAQFLAWLSCRRPRCTFDILVLRYETLEASVETLFDFLMLPDNVRKTFPGVRSKRHRSALDSPTRRMLNETYRGLEEAIQGIPPQGLLLQNS